MNPCTIILTDPPEIVDLKREFYELDSRMEELRHRDGGCDDGCLAVELQQIEARKAEIAHQILFWR